MPAHPEGSKDNAKKIGQSPTLREIHSWQKVESRLSHEKMVSLRLARWPRLLLRPWPHALPHRNCAAVDRVRLGSRSVGSMKHHSFRPAHAGHAGRRPAPWCIAAHLQGYAGLVRPAACAHVVRNRCAVLSLVRVRRCGAPHRLHSSPHARTGTCATDMSVRPVYVARQHAAAQARGARNYTRRVSSPELISR